MISDAKQLDVSVERHDSFSATRHTSRTFVAVARSSVKSAAYSRLVFSLARRVTQRTTSIN